jgi:hypothetical protein
MAQFTPPQFVPPQQNIPNPNAQNIPNISNIPGAQEQVGEVAKSVAKSQVIKTTTQMIINSREEFAQYLAQSGLDLVTSWVEFEKSRDFIQSSYVVYIQSNNFTEPLVDFLQRYPQLREPVQALNQKIAQQ